LLLLQSLHRIDAQNAYATPWLRDIVTEENLKPQTEANVALQNPRHLAVTHLALMQTSNTMGPKCCNRQLSQATFAAIQGGISPRAIKP